VIVVDANLLIYAVNMDSPHHQSARRWLEEVLSGTERVGFAWLVLLAFLRITTRPGILSNPLSGDQAVAYIDEWLAEPVTELIAAGDGHWPILRNLLSASGTYGNLTSDAHLAAFAIESGAVLYSADYDFQRFAGLQYVNPLVSSKLA
jgi:toxin-antitoxin system PIN domain toxin